MKQQSLRKGCNKKGKEPSKAVSFPLQGVLFTVDLLVLEEETFGLAGSGS